MNHAEKSAEKNAEKSQELPQRWGIWLAIEGDLRFLSHHDTIRMVERITARARLPVRYTQGFNPHPIMSLACPRPVGVTTQDDLVVVSLDGPADESELLRRLNANSPKGLRFLMARCLRRDHRPRPRRVDYEIHLPAEKRRPIGKRLAELADATHWPIERLVPVRRGPTRRRPIDLRPLVGGIDLDGEFLRITLEAHGDLWARPGEVLMLLGLDERVDLARMVRTSVDYGLQLDNAVADSPDTDTR